MKSNEMRVLKNFVSVYAIDDPKIIRLKEKIAAILLLIGIPSHVKGYQYLYEAIIFAANSSVPFFSLTKEVYPSIADKFKTRATSVERAIHHAIVLAWLRGKMEALENVIGYSVFDKLKHPKNCELIALLTIVLKMKECPVMHSIALADPLKID